MCHESLVQCGYVSFEGAKHFALCRIPTVRQRSGRTATATSPISLPRLQSCVISEQTAVSTSLSSAIRRNPTSLIPFSTSFSQSTSSLLYPSPTLPVFLSPYLSAPIQSIAITRPYTFLSLFHSSVLHIFVSRCSTISRFCLSLPFPLAIHPSTQVSCSYLSLVLTVP